MADTIEKIYCTDGRDNDLAAILAATKNNDPATMMAAMGGGMNNWMNNPFVYLVWMMFANRMWGGEQNCNPAIQAQIDSLRNQMADNQNSNLLMDAVHGNTSGSAHSWTTEQLRSVLGSFTPTHNETSGDIAYTANMAYADFYPAVLDTVDKCVTYAKLVASDPDGYEGMEFMRWTSDAIGKSLTLN